MTKYCKTCGFLDPKRPVCLLRGEQVDATADFCSKHQEIEFYENCPICGKPIYNTNAIVDVLPTGGFRYLHLSCAQALNTCLTCKHGDICEFQTNPDPMPKMVNKTIRQGNMMMQTTVANPSRIEKYCFNCRCFSQEFGCLKQNKCCDGKWEEAV